MAVATLERCYNNRHVFRGIVKIRKGEAVWLMMQASSIDKVKAVILHYLKQVGYTAYLRIAYRINSGCCYRYCWSWWWNADASDAGFAVRLEVKVGFGYGRI